MKFNSNSHCDFRLWFFLKSDLGFLLRSWGDKMALPLGRIWQCHCVCVCIWSDGGNRNALELLLVARAHTVGSGAGRVWGVWSSRDSDGVKWWSQPFEGGREGGALFCQEGGEHPLHEPDQVSARNAVAAFGWHMAQCWPTYSATAVTPARVYQPTPALGQNLWSRIVPAAWNRNSTLQIC